MLVAFLDSAKNVSYFYNMKPILTALLLFTFLGITHGQVRYDLIADSLGKAGQRDKILPYLEKELPSHPNDSLLLRSLAYMYMFTNDLDKGEKYYLKALSVNPDCGRCYAGLGQIFSKRGNYDRALGYLTKAIAIIPDKPVYYADRGVAREMTGDLTGALKDFNKAISMDPNVDDFYHERGAYYSDMGLSEKAMADYDKAIALNPKAYRSYYNRYMEKYRHEDMDGSCTDLHSAYTYLKEADPTNEALEEMKFSIGNICDTSKASYYYQRGIAAYNLQQFDQAVKIYNLGLKQFPDNAMLLSFKGNALFASKKYTEAVTGYNACLKNKDNVIEEAKANQAHLSLKNQSTETYVNGFVAGTELYLAQSYFALGQYGDAITAINKAIDIAPDLKELGKETYYNVRGNIYLAQNNFQQAVKDFDKCIQLNPTFADAYANRSLAKINLAKQVRIKYYTISGTNNNAFRPNWTLPVKMKANSKEADANLTAAYGDSNKAIELDPQQELAYYLRGHLKRMLDLGGYCLDLAKAKQLGYTVEPELLAGCSN